MNFSKFLRSFVIGFQGLAHAVASEQNMRLHCLAASGVIAMGLVLGLTSSEWVAIVLCIALVISAECFNTAVERLANRITLEQDPLIKQAKDCGSAAVLVMALASTIVGCLIFLPKLRAAAGW